MKYNITCSKSNCWFKFMLVWKICNQTLLDATRYILHFVIPIETQLMTNLWCMNKQIYGFKNIVQSTLVTTNSFA